MAFSILSFWFVSVQMNKNPTHPPHFINFFVNFCLISIFSALSMQPSITIALHTTLSLCILLDPDLVNFSIYFLLWDWDQVTVPFTLLLSLLNPLVG